MPPGSDSDKSAPFSFESVLWRCMSEGLVGDEGFAIDASVIKADGNRTRGVRITFGPANTGAFQMSSGGVWSM